jgi:hypothetical protein
MKSNINILPLLTWSNIPRTWEARPNVINYHQLPESEHFADGWRDVIDPSYNTATQRKGALIIVGDTVTWEVVNIPQDELIQNFESQIQSTASQLLEAEKQRQVMATFQAIEDEAEAFEVKEVFPFWDETFNYLTVTANYKVVRTLIEDGEIVLALFFLITPHTPAIGDTSFYPENAPALWSRVIIGAGGVEVWTQPTGGDGKYPLIDTATGLAYRVLHLGQTWENRRTLNTSEPSTSGSGWMQVSNLPAPWYFLGNEGYPLNWEVRHNGRLWRSTSAGNFWEPGVALWTDLGPI